MAFADGLTNFNIDSNDSAGKRAHRAAAGVVQLVFYESGQLGEDDRTRCTTCAYCRAVDGHVDAMSNAINLDDLTLVGSRQKTDRNSAALIGFQRPVIGRRWPGSD